MATSLPARILTWRSSSANSNSTHCVLSSQLHFLHSLVKLIVVFRVIILFLGARTPIAHIIACLQEILITSWIRLVRVLDWGRLCCSHFLIACHRESIDLIIEWWGVLLLLHWVAGGNRVVPVAVVVRSSCSRMRRGWRHVMSTALVNNILGVVLCCRSCRLLLLQAMQRGAVYMRASCSGSQSGGVTASTSRSVRWVALITEVLWVATRLGMLLLKVHRHWAHWAPSERCPTRNSKSLHLLLLFVLVTRGHVPVLARRAIVAAGAGHGRVRSCASSRHFLHSLLILEGLAY